MKKPQVLHSATCEDCGKPFFTLYGKYCEECAKKRKGTKHMRKKICVVCGRPKMMFMEQIVCRGCLEREKAQDKPRSVRIAEELRRARQTGGKLEKIEICPNFDGGNINCVTCEPGSFKFKDCGQK